MLDYATNSVPKPKKKVPLDLAAVAQEASPQLSERSKMLEQLLWQHDMAVERVAKIRRELFGHQPLTQ